jgi:hypothetical protein
MDHDNPATANGLAESSQPDPGKPDPGKAVLAVNGVIAAIGGTYASTHSLPVTIVAGCAGLACAVLFAWKK